jgi:hypothetical protein
MRDNMGHGKSKRRGVTSTTRFAGRELRNPKTPDAEKRLAAADLGLHKGRGGKNRKMSPRFHAKFKAAFGHG